MNAPPGVIFHSFGGFASGKILSITILMGQHVGFVPERVERGS